MNEERRINAPRRAVAILAAVLLAVAAIIIAPDRADPVAPHAPSTGEFTGEVSPHGPVYRFPPVRVVADRKAELARIEREEWLVREREALARQVPKPGA